MSALNIPTSTRRAIALLPVAFAAHIAEEWFGGFSEWTGVVVGRVVSPERFFLINALALPASAGCAFLSLRAARARWLAVSLAALFGLNGAAHALATVAFARYSPGVVTGLLLYMPLSAIVLRSLSMHFSLASFSRAAVFGVVVHGGVVLLAYL